MKTEPTAKMLELKQMLLATPKNERKAILDKGMEISRQRRKVAELKQEREQLKASDLASQIAGPAVPRTTSVDGVAQTSKTSGGQPSSSIDD